MKHYSIIACIVIFFGCGKEPIPLEIIGSYATSEVMAPEEKLTLSELGKFHMEKWYSSCFGTASVDVVSGTYQVNDNWIILRPETSSERYYEWDNIKEKKLVTDSSLSVNEMSSFNDSIYIVRWKKRVYLLGGNIPNLENPVGYYNSPLLDFINNINTGAEYTKRGREHLRNGYWNQACETCDENELGEALPLKWRDQLLDSTIKTQTIKMEPIFEQSRIAKYMVTISSGRKQGVRAGMLFYSAGSGCPFVTAIVEVSDKYSKGISYGTCEPKLGLTLSTFIQKE